MAKARKFLTDHEMDRIIRDKAFGYKTTEQIATEYDIATTSIWKLWRAFTLVQNKDENGMKHALCTGSTTLRYLKYAASAAGVTLSEDVQKAVKGKYEREKKRNAEKANAEQLTIQEEPEPEQQPEPMPAPAEIPPEVIVEKQTDNTALYLIKVLQALAEQNELLKQLMDAVIPHWIDDLKENNNANSGAIMDMLKPMDQKLDAIRCNSKRRGL